MEVLITVNTYPNPSRSQREAACVVGIRKQGGFVRLYPVPFRDLEDNQKFRKYQWIKVETTKPRNDPRPETVRPNFKSIQITSEVLSSNNHWSARKKIVMPLISDSLCEIVKRHEIEGTSVGVFKPAEVLDFDWSQDGPENWTPEELAKLTQKDMFLNKKKQLLEKIPYSFRYRFRCNQCKTRNPHHVTIVDWELAQQYRKLRRQSNSINECLQKLKDNWLGKLCGADRDTYFFTGNMMAHPKNFLVLGVFWPKKKKQLMLF
jgi:hypothetical protein